jgi:hypothetical protein
MIGMARLLMHASSVAFGVCRVFMADGGDTAQA